MHRHHAFISYAWADDQSFETDAGPDQRGGNRGWVSTFRDRYRKHLGREIGRIPEGERIWLDYEQLRGSDAVTSRIGDELKDSALLIPILSKAWFASPWCRQEFTVFTAQHPDWQRRLFPVWMTPVEPENLDEDDQAQAIRDQLRELLGYQFWYRNQANRIYTRWFPDIDSADRHYGYIQQDMAHDMAERLKQLGQLAEGIPGPAPTTPARDQPPTICDPPIPRFQGHQLVMINGGSSDVSLVREIARTLAACEGLGYVVPLMAQDLRADYKPSELRRDLRENLKQATAVLMVVHKGPPDQINEQLREYTQAAAKSQDRPPSLDVCLLGDQLLGFRPPGTRVHQVEDSNILDCACKFARELQA
ncbi:toll/interleukin-1 receptor domain-containing protein [Candidatus Thiosymbion oneisti]|uniref:toll/interleukin-1 receptor domain-containing protein n=1 Tax=Candidatus Thiosymbion oneisti TaxID=589554 RepID=UPI00105D283A|nr:toll/interleukin-1 receptor domain-containing protein [Candidatus Thiosymbion oneisti]